MSQNKLWSSALLGGTALLWMVPAFAQSAGPSDSVETVIVTADKRVQNAQQVPLSVEVVTPQAISAAGITDIHDLSQIVPGLNATTQASIQQPEIRGISSEGSTPGDESNVAVYIDGVYQPQEYTNNFDLPDIDNVQVLKGPQGTLYGRNATGGAILITTQQPSFEPEGHFSVSDGVFDHGGNDFSFGGFATDALVGDQLAGSLAVGVHDADGYTHDVLRDKIAGGEKSYYTRGKLLYQPLSSFSVTLAAYYQNRDDKNPFALENFYPLNFVKAAYPVPTKPYEVANSTPGYNKNDIYGVNLNVSWNTGLGNLSSVTSYQHVGMHVLFDGDESAAPIVDYSFFQPNTTYTEELDFASKQFGPLSFVTGLSGYDSVARYSPLAVLSPPPTQVVAIYAKSTALSAAGFFQATYNVTDNFSLIAGARYAVENRRYDGGLDTPNLTEIGKHQFDDATYRASATYYITGDTNVYFTFNQGYKSGVYDTSSFSPDPVRPEKANSYELGLKSQPLPNLTLNLAAYMEDISDLQVQTDKAVGFAILSNAASAKIRGIDADVTWNPLEGLTFKGGVTALPYAKYTDYPVAAVLIPDPVTGGTFTGQIDATGDRLLKTPKWQGNVSGTYEWDNSWGHTSVYANLYFVSAYSWDLLNIETQHAYSSLNTTLSWSPSKDSSYEVSLWGRNLTNVATILSPVEGGSAIGWSWGPPREIGVSFNVKQ